MKSFNDIQEGDLIYKVKFDCINNDPANIRIWVDECTYERTNGYVIEYKNRAGKFGLTNINNWDAYVLKPDNLVYYGYKHEYYLFSCKKGLKKFLKNFEKDIHKKIQTALTYKGI